MNNCIDWFSIAILVFTIPPLLLGSVYHASLPVQVRWINRLMLGALAFFALLVFTRFGQMNALYVDVNLNAEASTTNPWTAPRRWETGRNFHFHEVYLYYLGSKYLKEVRYTGFYDCVLLADAESFGFSKATFVRNLANVLEFMPADTARKIAQVAFRPRFSPARWEAFKKDVVFFQHLSPSEWWVSGVQDAGFNPPPTWSVIGGTLARWIPLNDRTYRWLPAFDVLLLLTGCVLLFLGFGWLGVTSFLIVYGTSYVAAYGWNGGAFLRYLWLWEIMGALTMLKRKRYFSAGLFLGLSTCMRVFPAYFAIGASIPLLLDNTRRRDTGFREARQFWTGFIVVAIPLILLSLWMYDLQIWHIFFDRIFRHGNIFFVRHLGFKKIVTFDTWVPRQNFFGDDGLFRFTQWNIALMNNWTLHWRGAYAFLALISVLAVAAARKRPPYESALMIGLSGMFFFHMPANYYFVVWSLVPAVLFLPRARWEDASLGVAFMVFLIFVGWTPIAWRDDIVQTYYTCWAFALFMTGWMLVRIGASRFSKK